MWEGKIDIMVNKSVSGHNGFIFPLKKKVHAFLKLYGA